MKRLILEILLGLLTIAGAGGTWWMWNKASINQAALASVSNELEAGRVAIDSMTERMQGLQRKANELDAVRAALASGVALEDIEAAARTRPPLSRARACPGCGSYAHQRQHRRRSAAAVRKSARTGGMERTAEIALRGAGRPDRSGPENRDAGRLPNAGCRRSGRCSSEGCRSAGRSPGRRSTAGRSCTGARRSRGLEGWSNRRSSAAGRSRRCRRNSTRACGRSRKRSDEVVHWPA